MRTRPEDANAPNLGSIHQTLPVGSAQELGVSLPDAGALHPHFLSVTETVADSEPHIDGSVWFLVPLSRGTALSPDAREIDEVRWWSRRALDADEPHHFDPHLERCLDK